MKIKKNYLSPTIHVVEMTIGKVMLNSSATLDGYKYQANTADDGWED